MPYDHRKCEDEDDAARMAETILRELGYVDVQRGASVSYGAARAKATLAKATLQAIALNAERIARWARRASKE